VAHHGGGHGLYPDGLGRGSLNFAFESGHPANSKEVSACRYNVRLAYGSGRHAKFTAVKPDGLGGEQCAGRTKRQCDIITKQASGTAKIDPLMAAFNAVAWMSANPASSQPCIFVI
jgi:hypothetical protein